jgi:hypothetical protein
MPARTKKPKKAVGSKVKLKDVKAEAAKVKGGMVLGSEPL